MLAFFKKIIFVATLNSALILMLIVGIQNSSDKKKVNLLIGQTVSLPISFIVGISFISGSLMGSLIIENLSAQKDSF